MSRLGYAAIILLLLGSTVAEAKDPVADSVVKIYATRRAPDYSRPWTKSEPAETSGSGVIVEGNRILTNAHVVSYSSQLFVQASQSAERLPAKVLALAPGMDLALVEVDCVSFFEGRSPIALTEGLPTLKKPVSVYGYPMGGEQLSITQGIISRIEYDEFYYEDQGLRIQIDAALNPGNSGGPAIADGKLVGLVFSKIPHEENAENIGYLIAAEEIATFLADAADGSYEGKPLLWDPVSNTENRALQSWLGLKQAEGALVYQPESAEPSYPLKRRDVILKIGDHPLDRMGNVSVSEDLKLNFRYFVAKLSRDGKVPLTILRDKEVLEVQVPTSPKMPLVIPYLAGRYPRYFIYGPVVFTVASQELVRAMAGAKGNELALLQSPLLMRLRDLQTSEGEELVVLTRSLLSHPITQGYIPYPYSVVSQINGTPVRNLAHLVELLRDAEGEFLTIELAGRLPPLVFRREEIAQSTEEILSSEGIRRQSSEDLEKVWHPR